jgi:predicted DNA-binding transcriptional regulator YafY
MSRNDRLFDLIQLMRDGRLHRASDLAARLGVSTRTVWRDMAVLASSGLPVEGERGVGYILRGPITLPPLILTEEEVAAMTHLLALAAAHADTGIARGARSLAAKIAAVLPQAVPDEDEG